MTVSPNDHILYAGKFPEPPWLAIIMHQNDISRDLISCFPPIAMGISQFQQILVPPSSPETVKDPVEVNQSLGQIL